jgi:polyhydroxybutyrate depolymerase
MPTFQKAAFFLLLISLGSLQLPAQTSVHSFTHAGIVRSFRVHIPPTYTGSVDVPLVFNLHGYTSNASQQELYSNMNAVADTANFILCYPDGINAAWNSGFSPPYNGGVDDVGFISRLIDTLATWYTIDLARVYSCGMSNGGFMSYRLACDLENRIAAIASVTGSMSPLQASNCTASRSVPVMEVHGDADATVPYNGATGMLPIDSVVNFWRGVNQCTAPVVVTNLPDIAIEGSTATTYFYGGCDAGTEVLHYKVSNGGHTWPGAFPFPSLGNTNQDFSASVDIWRFFNRFVHPAPLLLANQVPQPRLSVFPNPIQTEFCLQNLSTNAQVQVMDAQGRIVLDRRVVQGELHADASNWAVGVYMVQVRTDEGLQQLRVVKVE